MDVFIKYAYAVILAQKNIYGAEKIEEITEEMIDSEIEKSFDFIAYFSDDNPKIKEKSNFNIYSQNQILSVVNENNKNNVKLLQHLCVSPKTKVVFYKSSIEKHLKDRCGGLNFSLFSATTYISKDGLGGFNLNQFEKKLYFLAHITPYKPSFFKTSPTTIYMDLPMDLLVQYVKIFIEEWKNFNLNKTIETDAVRDGNDRLTQFYHYPKVVNFPTPEKYYRTSSDVFYIKLYALSYFDQFKELAKIYGYDKLHEKLGEGSIVEISVDTPMRVFKLSKELVELTENNQLLELLVALKKSFTYTYGDKSNKQISTFTYAILKMLKDLKNTDNIRIINDFKIKFYKFTGHFDNDKFLNTMKKLFGYNLPAEIIDEIIDVVKIIKGGIYTTAKEKTKDNPSKLYDMIDHSTDDIAYSIKAMNNLSAMLKLPENIKRRAGRNINIANIFNYLAENPQNFNDVKNVINFYLYQKLNDKKEVVLTEEENILYN